MINSVKYGTQKVLPFVKQTVKYMGAATFTFGTIIGIDEGIKRIQSTNLPQNYNIIERAAARTVPFMGNVLGGFIFAPVVVSMKVNELYNSVMENKKAKKYFDIGE